MINLIIGLILLLIGLVGIIKNKFPKYQNGLGYTAAMRYYLSFWGLLILGISLIKSWILK